MVAEKMAMRERDYTEIGRKLKTKRICKEEEERERTMQREDRNINREKQQRQRERERNRKRDVGKEE